jgi:hypothetical protein
MNNEKLAEVQRLINLVNILSENPTIPDPEETIKKICDEKFTSQNLSKSSEEAWHAAYLEAFSLWTKQLGGMLRADEFSILLSFLYTSLPGDEYPDELHGKIRRLVDLLKGYDRLNAVLGVFDQILSRAKEHSASYEKYGESIYSWEPLKISAVTLIANGKMGEIDYKFSNFLESIRGCELVRFKRCDVCNSVFYASKTNAQTCQTKCTKTLDNWKQSAKRKGEVFDLVKYKNEHQERLQKKLILSKGSDKKDDRRRRLNYYLAKGINYCTNCVHPLKTCDCLKKKEKNNGTL